MLRPVSPQKESFNARMRILNRLVLLGVALFIPLYLFVRFTGGSVESLEKLPELIDRIKRPIVWEVPEDGVKYLNFYHGEADEGDKFVLVHVRMEARMKIAFPIVPRCFRLVDDQNTRYFPFSHSPLFIEYSDEIHLDEGDVLDGELLFEISRQRQSVNLLFDRYRE